MNSLLISFKIFIDTRDLANLYTVIFIHMKTIKKTQLKNLHEYVMAAIQQVGNINRETKLYEETTENLSASFHTGNGKSTQVEKKKKQN